MVQEGGKKCVKYFLWETLTVCKKLKIPLTLLPTHAIVKINTAVGLPPVKKDDCPEDTHEALLLVNHN